MGTTLLNNKVSIAGTHLLPIPSVDPVSLDSVLSIPSFL